MPLFGEGTNGQSTNPFQADSEARRAVSTVPPMTTSFYGGMDGSSSRRRDRRSEVLRTNVSWIELVLRPSGARNPLKVSMVQARVMGAGESGGRENAYPTRGKGGLYAIRECLVAFRASRIHSTGP